MASPVSPMISLIYSSTATQPLDDEALSALLQQSRENNAARAVTGMLLYRNGRFLQVIEGPEQQVRDLLGVLMRDARHTVVRVLFEEPVEVRQFPAWSMGYERADTDTEREIPGYRISNEDLDGAEHTTATVRAMRELVQWFQRRPDRSNR